MEQPTRYQTPKCCVCGKFVSESDAWVCESCDGEHHDGCSGDNSPGWGECPDETAYSHCKKCVNVTNKD